MKVYKFEDLTIWQLARSIVKDIYVIFESCKDFGFTNQTQRAAVSIMNNIAEGFDRSRNSKDNKQFVNFLNISYGSCGEVRSMLYTAEDLGYINPEEAKNFRNRCTDMSIKIDSLMTTLRQHEVTNTK